MASTDPQSNTLWRASGLGLELAGSILAGTFFGWLVDKWLDSAPWGVLIGTILGIVVGGISFTRSALKLNREAQEEYRRQKAERRRQDAENPAPPPPETGPAKRDYADTRSLFERELRDPDEEDSEDVRFPDDFDKW